MKTKSKKQTKQGISLIVLVITIIVMIILAAAVILSLSSNGIIDRANEAVDKTDKAQVQNLASLAWSEAYLNGARTKEELMLETYKILKEQGITKEDYILEVSTSGVGVIDANSWDHAYTCTGGVWSDKIGSGKPAIGEIVAKFYKTGNKVSLTDEALQNIEESSGRTLEKEHDEYKMVMTGQGTIGDFVDAETGIPKAWLIETYDLLMGNKDTSVLLGTTEVIISGKIENIESMNLNTWFSLTDLTIEDAIIKIAGPEDEEGNFAGSETVTALKNIIFMGEGIEIGKYAFLYYTSLESVTIGDGITSIGECAFGGCTSLESVTIGDDVTNIGNGAFYTCTSLTSIIIPDSVTNIDAHAFLSCTSLTSIIIPDSVVSIGVQAFEDCYKLETVYYTGTEDEWNQISIGSGNEELTNANIIFNYTPNN